MPMTGFDDAADVWHHLMQNMRNKKGNQDCVVVDQLCV